MIFKKRRTNRRFHSQRILRTEILEHRAVPAVLTVTSLADSGPGTLREALDVSNSNGDADQIVFDSTISGGTINLTSGELMLGEFQQPLEIQGSNVTIDAGGLNRVLQVSDGDDYVQSTTVSLADLTISGGDAGTYTGGGIYNLEILNLDNVTITGNSAESGGGLFSVAPTSIVNSTVSGNTVSLVDGRGGGMYLVGFDPYNVFDFSIVDSEVSGNSANLGGGVHVGGDTNLEITGSEFSGNSAIDAGGALNVTNFSGVGLGFNDYATRNIVTISDSDFVDNELPQSLDSGGNAIFPYGAGIFSNRGTEMTIIGGSISGNSNGDGNDGAARGSGITVNSFFDVRPNDFNRVVLDDVDIADNIVNDGFARGGGAMVSRGGDLVIRNSTLSGNDSNGDGGALGLIFDGKLTVEDSMISGNRATVDGGGFSSVGFNLADDGVPRPYVGPEASFTRTTMNDNVADNSGGAIWFVSTKLTTTNATFSANSSPEGSAITNANELDDNGGFEIRSSTFTGNIGTGGVSPQALVTTFGAGQDGFGGVLTDSLLSDNTGGDLYDINGYTDITFTLIESGTNIVNGQDGNIVASATLGPLQNNGSANGVSTHALLGPEGIGAANPNSSLQLDGRGLERPGADGARDIGAHESDAPTSVTVDFDGNGVAGCSDINALQAEIAQGTNDSQFDLDTNGSVDAYDQLAWLALAAEFNLGPGTTPYQRADFNLDRVVDVSDFGIWNGAKFTVNSAFCSGDANADGVVDVTDFGVWNALKFTAADSAGSAVGFFGNAKPETFAASGIGRDGIDDFDKDHGGLKDIENVLPLQRREMNLFVASTVEQGTAEARSGIGGFTVSEIGETNDGSNELSSRDIVDLIFARTEATSE
ncbi:MAG: hypothetical protein AAF497_01760 [Planctomycetota bacterium]